MVTSDMLTQSINAYKTKLKHLINDLTNDLEYLYEHYFSCIFVTRRKNNASTLIQIKIKNDKTITNGAEIIFNMKL